MTTMNDRDVIAWARMRGFAGIPWKNETDTRELLVRLADLAEKGITILDCGQDLCATAPGCMRHWAERNRELVAKAETQSAEIARLQDALFRDQSGLAAALRKIVDEIGGRLWVEDTRGPYEWDDDRYKAEAGNALRTAREIARSAIGESGKVVTKAIFPAPPGGER